MKKITAVLLCILFFSESCVFSHAVSVSAAACVLVHADTGELLYSKALNEKLPIASTTKILTALTVIENVSLSKVCTVGRSEALTEGTSLGLKSGNKITVQSLLYGLMLESGNDAANVLARSVSGSIGGFAELMNKKARQIGMTNSHFVNPSGLPDDEHYSTAYDMALLTCYALKNERFRQICSQKSAIIDFVKPQKSVTLHNHNRLLNTLQGCIGVKTGYTKKAGRCLVSAVCRSGTLLVAVTLNDADDWEDHRELYDFGFSSLKKTEISLKNIQVAVVGSDKQKICASVRDKVIVFLPDNADKKIKTRVVLVSRFLYAPVNKGDKVACLQIIYGNKIIKTFFLYSDSSAFVKCER